MRLSSLRSVLLVAAFALALAVRADGQEDREDDAPATPPIVGSHPAIRLRLIDAWVSRLGVQRGETASLSLSPDAALAGTAGGGPFEVVTDHGACRVPAAEVAVLIGGLDGESTKLCLRQGEVLVGPMRAPDLALDAADGTSVHIDLAGIRGLVFPSPSVESAIPPTTHAFVLTAAGNRLAVTWAPESRVRLATPWGTLRVPWREVHSLQLQFAPNAGWLVRLIDGSRIHARPADPQYELDTPRFGRVTLPAAEVTLVERIPGEGEDPPTRLEDTQVEKATQSFVVLRNGDAFPATIDPVSVRTAGALREQLAFLDLRWLRRVESETPGSFQALLRDGRTVTVVLAEATLTARGARGVLRLPLSHLEAAACGEPIGPVPEGGR